LQVQINLFRMWMDWLFRRSISDTFILVNISEYECKLWIPLPYQSNWTLHSRRIFTILNISRTTQEKRSCICWRKMVHRLFHPSSSVWIIYMYPFHSDPKWTNHKNHPKSSHLYNTHTHSHHHSTSFEINPIEIRTNRQTKIKSNESINQSKRKASNSNSNKDNKKTSKRSTTIHQTTAGLWKRLWNVLAVIMEYITIHPKKCPWILGWTNKI